MSETTIQGRQLFKGGNYSRKYGIFFFIFIVNNTGGNCTLDEFKCQEPEMELENNSYILKDKCVSQDKVNDGRPDCEDKSDEFGNEN